MSQLAELEEAMRAPGYEPLLAGVAAVASMFGVTPQAVSGWAARSDRTGVRRYGRGKVDVRAVARWIIIRNDKKVTRTPAQIDE